jgi:methylglutaconyl-CoA hydratase
VLTGAGKSFSAGADLNWMQEMANYSMEANLGDAGRLADMLHALDSLPQPTVAKINGGAYGGAVGLIGACDIAIAQDDASFGITEVRLGLIPSVISPYVLRAIGPRQARRYSLTGERFDAAEALRIGLVHRVERKKTFDAAVDDTVDRLVAGAPGAQEEVKALFRDIWELGRTGEKVRADTAQRIAKRRASDEAREGMTAFLGKRKPSWTAPAGSSARRNGWAFVRSPSIPRPTATRCMCAWPTKPTLSAPRPPIKVISNLRQSFRLRKNLAPGPFIRVTASWPRTRISRKHAPTPALSSSDPRPTQSAPWAIRRPPRRLWRRPACRSCPAITARIRNPRNFLPKRRRSIGRCC